MNPIAPGVQVPQADTLTAREAAQNVMRRIQGYGRNRCAVFIDRAGGLRVRQAHIKIPDSFQPIRMVGMFTGSTPFDALVVSCSSAGFRSNK